MLILSIKRVLLRIENSISPLCGVTTGRKLSLGVDGADSKENRLPFLNEIRSRVSLGTIRSPTVAEYPLEKPTKLKGARKDLLLN